MKILRAVFLVLMLAAVLAAAAGFIYMETAAKKDISRWLTEKFGVETVVGRAGLRWPASLSLREVAINNTALIEKVNLTASPADISAFVFSWFKGEEVIFLPAKVVWKNLRLHPAADTAEGRAQSRIGAFFRELNADGELAVVMGFNRDNLALGRVSFKGEIVTGSTEPARPSQ